MSTDLQTLGATLRSQLINLTGGSPGTPDIGLEITDTFEDPDSENRVRQIQLQLSPAAAEALSGALANLGRHGTEDTPEDQDWNAVSERVSEIEGFTGGEASE